MGTATSQPKWWSEEKHDSAWERVKEAMKRDWEQTKNDFSAGGKDLSQDVDDTVKQVAGKEPIPAANVKNAPTKGEVKAQAKKMGWDDVEGPMAYGYGARTHYTQHTAWDDKLEGTLRTEWESTKSASRWDDVKQHVRRGYDARK
jgi:hypothetical protein